MGESVNVDQLFHKSWFKPLGLNTLLLILYSPIGLCLLIIRAFILLQYILLAISLPPSKFRQKCLRVMAGVLGLTISTEGEADQSSGKIFVANHITCFDHLVINLAAGGVKPVKEALHASTPFASRALALVAMTLERLAKEDVEALEDSLILFPEGASTNGERGILSFTAEPIPVGVTVQPVAIQVSRMFMNTSCVGSSLMQEALAAMICPNTHFTLTFLSVATTDSEDSWRQRTQSAIAQTLNLTPTKLNSSDKNEFVKRLFFRPPSLATMAREVQKQLAPQSISPELIIATLQRTGSVEGTLESLRQSCPSGGNTPPSTFPKSATQRMTSFQERKRIMIANARAKYIEKHNLNLS